MKTLYLFDQSLPHRFNLHDCVNPRYRFLRIVGLLIKSHPILYAVHYRRFSLDPLNRMDHKVTEASDFQSSIHECRVYGALDTALIRWKLRIGTDSTIADISTDFRSLRFIFEQCLFIRYAMAGGTERYWLSGRFSRLVTDGVAYLRSWSLARALSFEQ